MRQVEKREFGKCLELEDGGLKATIAPEMGFSLVSLEFNGEQILDEGTTDNFLKCRKGLGPLILPWFNKRPKVPELDCERFQHVRYLRNLGIEDPFQHGVARYLPWEYEKRDSSLCGSIRGGGEFQGMRISDLAGFDFDAQVVYTVKAGFLEVAFGIKGEQPVASGIHFYYKLKNQEKAVVNIPAQGSEEEIKLPLDMDKGYDNVYLPGRKEEKATYILDGPSYRLHTQVKVIGRPEETFDSVIVFKPVGASFVCIEPISYVVGSPNVKKENRGTIRLAVFR